MKRIVALSLVLSACASNPAADPGPGGRRTVLMRTQVGQYVELPSDPQTVAVEVALPPEQAWRRLIAVYEALEIPVSTVQTEEMRLGNPSFTVRNRIGDLRAARVFDCGRGRGGAMVAELYPIQVSLHTRLAPSAAGGGTRVETTLAGVAQDAGGTSTNPLRCGSTGALERAISERLAGTLPG